MQPERVDDVPLHVLGVRRSGRRLDHLPEQGVADVGVLELLVGGQHIGLVGRRGPQRRLVRELPSELPEVAIVPVADDATAVGEQFPQCPVADRLAGQPTQPGVDPVVQPETTSIQEPKHCRGCERLRVRGHAEQV